METQLSGSHKSTYDAVFQHPVSRNLKWVDVHSLLTALADSIQEHGDVLKVTRRGKTLVLHRPNRNGMGDISELMKMRHFLEQTASPVAEPVVDHTHFLIVIDHRMARVYRTELQGTVPQRITPLDPAGSDRHLHYVADESNGQRKPERKSFYEAVAKAIHGAQQILLFGSGTGASSAMEQLIAELNTHHADLAARIVGSEVVDEQHLTENQLLAKAREFYAKIAG